MDDASTALAERFTDTLPGVAIRVPAFYAGPPGIVNGGWAAGLSAGLLLGPDTAPGTPIEVTLRAPMPLDAPVTGHRDGDRAAVTDAAGAVLTEARVVATIDPVNTAPPAFVPLAVAERAGAPGNRVESPLPGCYVCGMRRDGGLRVAIGRTAAAEAAGSAAAAGAAGLADHFAGAWTPPDASGDLPARYVWAALDCPTGLVHLEDGQALLGRFTVVQYRAPRPGEPHVIVAAPTGAERRKRFSSAALYTREGELVAHATAIWIMT
jgi:hypothetical protein